MKDFRVIRSFIISVSLFMVPAIACAQNIGYIERHTSMAFEPDRAENIASESELPAISPSRKDVILIDTSKRLLSFTSASGARISYPIAVGKQGAQWKGSAIVGRKTVNPVWHPTKNQRKKKKLPLMVKPGPKNPLGPRALYLWVNGKETLYRIHGTNEPSSIGKAVSSGCIRMRNSDVIQLYDKVRVGTLVKVV